MTLSTVQHLVFKQASATVGGTERLCRLLNVSMPELQDWMEGRELAPTRVFNEAVKLANCASKG